MTGERVRTIIQVDVDVFYAPVEQRHALGPVQAGGEKPEATAVWAARISALDAIVTPASSAKRGHAFTAARTSSITSAMIRSGKPCRRPSA